MPHTITSLFQAVGLTPIGVVPWGAQLPCKEKGVYVVALTELTNSLAGTISSLPVSTDSIQKWITEKPDLLVDAIQASVKTIDSRIAQYWLPNEVVLYIGKTESNDGLCGRVGQFYKHVLGHRSPHKGGQWLKTLDVLSRLYIHYSPCSESVVCESAMIGHFCGGNAKGPFPFANLEWRVDGKRHLRQHGIR